MKRRAKMECELERVNKTIEQVSGEIYMLEEKVSNALDLWSLKMNPQICRNVYLKMHQQERIDLLSRRADLLATKLKIEQLLAKRRDIVSEGFSDHKRFKRIQDTFDYDGDPILTDYSSSDHYDYVDDIGFIASDLEDPIYFGDIHTESLVVDDPVGAQTIHVSENVLDVGGTESFFHSAGVGSSLEIGQRELLNISNFLARPVEIDSFEVKVGDDISAVYPLWDLFTLNPSVRAKIRNYAYLRADLHVRIAVSGSPFHFGRVLLSYQPYPKRNANIDAYDASILVDPLMRSNFVAYLSQAPGSTTMDVRANRPVEILCPFISTKPMHRLYNSQTTAISGATSFVDLEEAGSLYVYSIAPIAAASESPTPISFQIYAWLENVELGCTTATHLEIVTEGDERRTGPVERLATSMATLSRALEIVPGIEPFAKASTYVFQGIKGLSAWFGWSRPPIIAPPAFMKNRPYSNTSQTIGSETIERITLDPLQELTIDPGVVGIAHDELSIANLCSIESYIVSFGWASTDVTLADPIWLCGVHPNLDSFHISGDFIYFQPSPMSFVASLFNYWRGTIKYRFEIVCSAFHRGKLAFFYEPNANQEAIIDMDLSINKNFLKIVDIQETQNIEFCVNWAQPRAWNRILGPAFANSLYGAAFNPVEGVTNGYIGVVPFTDLQSPDDSPITINVYVSGENIQFNVLTDENLPMQREIIVESADVSGNIADGALSCFDLNDSTASAAHTADFHFGEHPVSLRACLKRYVRTYGVSSPFVPAHNSITWTRPILETQRPAYGDTVTTGVNIFEYLPYAFLGVRGGVRKRLNMVTSGTIGPMAAVVVSIDASTDVPVTGASSSTSLPSLQQRGSAHFVPWTNGGVEVEFPFYTNNLFVFSFALDHIGVNGSGDMDEFWYKQYSATFETTSAANSANLFLESTAVGEDFCFLRFNGAPFYSSDWSA